MKGLTPYTTNKNGKRQNIIVYYILRYFEARNTLRLNKEFWIVLILSIGCAIILEPFLGTKAILVPIVFIVFIPLFILVLQIYLFKK